MVKTIPTYDPSYQATDEVGAPTRYFHRYILSLSNNINMLSNTIEVSTTLEDDSASSLSTGYAGYGEVMAGDNQEWATFRFNVAGIVTINDSSTNVSNSDSDGDLCIFHDGSSIVIKNRLGSSLNVRYSIKYNRI
jgi:hypothetical protein